MPIHIIGDKSFVLRDPRVQDTVDGDIAPIIKGIETAIREKLPTAKYLVMLEMPGDRSHYLSGDADGPLRRDKAIKMIKRLYHLFTTGR